MKIMKKKNELLQWLQTIALAFVITLIFYNFIFIPCKVEGTSMYPTLENGDFGCSFILSRNTGINRFDTVVIKTDSKLLVKRVIGLPNETIEYKDNKLYINNEYIEESFLSSFNVFTDDFSYKLNDDEYYCLGDNRMVSRDSRYYGPFSYKQIIASHILVIYPFSNFGVKS